MRHLRYCIAQHPGIPFNVTNTTHFSTLPTPPMLAHNHLNHAGIPPTSPTLARHSRQHANHVTHLTTPLTLARHPRNHATHASMPPMQTCHRHQHATHASTPTRHPCQHATHASTQLTPPMLARQSIFSGMGLKFSIIQNCLNASMRHTHNCVYKFFSKIFSISYKIVFKTCLSIFYKHSDRFLRTSRRVLNLTMMMSRRVL